MGACYNEETFPPVSPEKLRELYQELTESLDHEYGRQEGYSGRFNCCSQLNIHNQKVFKTDREANEFVSKHTGKRDVMAVRVGDFGLTFDSTKKGQELRVARDKASKVLEAWEPGIIQRVKAAKSKTKGCGHCGSAIAVHYIRSTKCPVCEREYLVTATDRQKLESLIQKQKAAKAAYLEAKRAFEKKHPNDAHWYVGGWCPE